MGFKSRYGIKILASLLALLLLSACTPQEQEEAEQAAAPAQGATAAAAAVAVERPDIIGFVIEDDGSAQSALLMHGFLRMAENMGYPAKIYRAAAGEASVLAVEAAAAEGCKGILVQNRGGGNDAAVQKAVEAGLKVVVPYDSCALEGLHANVVADDAAYIEEIAGSIATRLEERSIRSGRILVYAPHAAQAETALFEQAVASYFPQYKTAVFIRSAPDAAGAAAELAEYLLYNRDIEGMYVTSPELASIAVEARGEAQTRLRRDGAPSPTPEPTPEATPTPAPEASAGTDTASLTPVPTVAPGLLTQISITVFAVGESAENYALLRANDIYGLCIEPYYDVAAHAAMTLDQLVSGDAAAALSQVHRPIVSAETVDKHALIYEQTMELFGLDGQG